MWYNKNKILITLVSIFLAGIPLAQTHAVSFFSGYAGLKTDFGFTDKTSSSFNPDLLVQSFFAGQFNITDNLIGRAEFSLSTSDLIENSVFEKTAAEFQVDELSLIYRKQFSGASNYFSLFMGTYEPIGSDMFLRRQFGIQPICSKLTESWLGLSGSVVYPLFGIGFSDIVHFSAQPIAAGVYFYMNHEISDSFVLNGDARFACVYPYLYLDLAAGAGAPLKTNYGDQSVIVLVDTLYGHAGTVMLLGNNYTTFSLFTQAGIYDIPMQRGTSTFTVDADKVYLLVEPRIKLSTFLFRVTLFSLPSDTVERLLFIDDTLGLNILNYAESLYIKNVSFSFGINTTFSYADKNISTMSSINSSTDKMNVAFSPFISMNIMSGELHIMQQMKVTEIARSSFASAFRLNIGYKTQL